jgi:hypothetical protein
LVASALSTPKALRRCLSQRSLASESIDEVVAVLMLPVPYDASALASAGGLNATLVGRRNGGFGSPFLQRAL